MSAYEFSTERDAYIKVCPSCKKIFVGFRDQETSEKYFTKHFARDDATNDGFYGRCRECVSISNQRRRKGREDCEPAELFELQDGKCGICSEPISLQRQAYRKTIAYVDHNHKTGKVRGLLCHRCNCKLGMVEDSDWLSKALEYIARSNAYN